MFKAFMFYPAASGTTPTEVTAGIDTDQEYEITLHVAPNNIGGGVFIYDSPASTSGYFLAAAPSAVASGTTPVENWNPEITLRLSGEKVYAVANTKAQLAMYVIAHST